MIPCQQNLYIVLLKEKLKKGFESSWHAQLVLCVKNSSVCGSKDSPPFYFLFFGTDGQTLMRNPSLLVYVSPGGQHIISAAWNYTIQANKTQQNSDFCGKSFVK